MVSVFNLLLYKVGFVGITPMAPMAIPPPPLVTVPTVIPPPNVAAPVVPAVAETPIVDLHM